MNKPNNAAVERLHAAYMALTDCIADFHDHDEKFALYDAAQAILEIGMKHDVNACLFCGGAWDE